MARTERLADVYAISGSAAEAPDGIPEAFAASFGIPDAELTPRVRAALASLSREVDGLKSEVEQIRTRLDLAARSADQDMLLPILNRRAFVREIARFIAFAERYGTPSSLLYFDLNNFKAVNDVYGHTAGDMVLRHFSDLIANNIRETDVLARLGGDEFGVILAHVTLEQAEKKGAALAQALLEHPPAVDGGSVKLSFAFGAYELRAGTNPDAAIAQADRAMYARKHAGRRPATP